MLQHDLQVGATAVPTSSQKRQAAAWDAPCNHATFWSLGCASPTWFQIDAARHVSTQRAQHLRQPGQAQSSKCHSC